MSAGALGRTARAVTPAVVRTHGEPSAAHSHFSSVCLFNDWEFFCLIVTHLCVSRLLRQAPANRQASTGGGASLCCLTGPALLMFGKAVCLLGHAARKVPCAR